ncbi:SDR family NAD(P)-dependent oxidoreductase [Actinomycetospora sp. NBRC 106378]|uniref:SDR family NAD(P)-dependent oxidoreductase n=1 Tax=Actinomycetospora sp. NBRC 106378 TaxID=3032208 RepID=UPI0024A0861D|nr:SDR family NAD(P)-dependent oxidoreductase [Actinomycetospora sp. NBRC 106378]GLZ52560.1 2,5-dichloro-2,5-cyclohexadiene-1,4-diol dehydrogenase [Actinomycetospora sp. NBRC 106378]
MRRLEGRRVVLTGATGGLGTAIARRLVDEGASVALTDVVGTGLDELAAALGGSTLVATLDVADPEDWSRAVTAVQERWGAADVLVNNAGIGSLGTVETETRDRWDQVVATDQLGVWLGMQHVGPVIEAAGGGSIVNVASILGATGGFGNSFSYAAAKGAVRAMTRNAALHWARRGVRVNAVVPGFIGTAPLLERFEGTERHRAMLDHTPMARLGRPEEVAAAVAFLASDDATYTTGSELWVDGGWGAR